MKITFHVKGQLPNADVEYNIKHPTLLHNELHFMEYVVLSAQEKVMEA